MKEPFCTTNRRHIEQLFSARTGVPFPSRRRVHILGAVAAALAIALCLPMMTAAGIPAAYDLLYTISPGAAQFFKPVRRACEDNGIRMEVLSSYVHGDTAEIYVAVRDLISDRVDGTIDLYDSYDIRAPFRLPSSVVSSAAPRVDYDEQTRTATFYITLTQEGVDFAGDKITFSAREFLSHIQKIEGPLAIDPSAASLSPPTQQIEDLRGSSYFSEQDLPEYIFGVGYTVLAPQQAQVLTPGVTFTAMGFVDGKLRIQLRYDDIAETDNHGSITLQNREGKEIAVCASVAFWDEDQRDSYQEYLFDVAPEELEGLTLHGAFWTNPTHVRGNWEITFPLEKA